MDTDGEFSDASSDGDRLSYDCSESDRESLSYDCSESDRESLSDDQVIAPNANAVLTVQEIGQRLSQEVAATAELFSVPADWALALLGHYRWNPLRLQDEWFTDQGLVRDAVGLGDAAVGSVPGADGEELMTCAICTEGKPAEEMASAGCAHYYCHDCWRGYVAAALDDGGDGDGGRCLGLRCPDASCSRAVLSGMAERFATGAGRDAYARALARAYVEARHLRFKPCTAPGCSCVIEISRNGGVSDLVCRCGNAFCRRCGGSPHWPASCAAVARWAREADEASADWILLNTKACPRCHRRIYRDPGGCNSMVCAKPCGYFFCWGCLGHTVACRVGEHDLCGTDETWKATEEEALERLRLRAIKWPQQGAGWEASRAVLAKLTGVTRRCIENFAKAVDEG